VPRPSRLRRAAVALATVACAATTAACSGSDADTARAATPASPALSGTYLALGDSVPFGYRGRPAGTDYSKAANFTGYPEIVADRWDLDVVNATCPGETTASFTDVTAQSNGCENALHASAGYRTFHPLHVLYDSVNQSQLDFAVKTLQRHEDVSLVTLQLGANDAFLCAQTTTDQCASEAGTLAQTVQANLGRILTALRDRGGYRGRVVVVTYYALQYTGAAATVTQLLDGAIAAAAQAHGATVASGFDAFKETAMTAGGDSVAAGLVIRNDVHPTAKGQELLARAVEDAVTG
jgi:lysophospholipase L1-like esterase